VFSLVGSDHSWSFSPRFQRTNHHQLWMISLPLINSMRVRVRTAFVFLWKGHKISILSKSFALTGSNQFALKGCPKGFWKSYLVFYHFVFAFCQISWLHIQGFRNENHLYNFFIYLTCIISFAGGQCFLRDSTNIGQYYPCHQYLHFFRLW